MYTNGNLWIAAGEGNARICLEPAKANRHGLIAGATGTGKTVTLKVMAESFSDAGVPVFLADVKGDLAGMTLQGTPNSNVESRVQRFDIREWSYKAFPTRFWDVYGKAGHCLRTTITEMGPLLLGRVLDLNPTQTGILNIAFRVADENGLLLLELKDLKAMMRYLSENAKELSAEYGNMTPQSINAIMRSLVYLEDQGGDLFFGEPAFDVRDWMQTTYDGRGWINILHCVELFQSPKLYSTFLLWMLSELYEELPEAGDLSKPKIVFFFDEAHLLFDDAPKALLQKIEQVVRLVRSKGVGVYFITQSPTDIPDEILAQLGNRVQHALRAYTPAEQKKVRAAADTFRANPNFRTLDAIMELATGEALVSFLGDDGAPAPVERCWILPPQSHMGSIEDGDRAEAMARDGVGSRYDEMIDRESAYELLTRRAEEIAAAYQEALEEAERQQEEEARRREEEKQELARQKEEDRLRREEEKALAARQREEEKALAAQQRAEERAQAAAAREKEKKTAARTKKVQRIATSAANSATRSVISSTIRRPVSKKQGIATNALNSAFNSTVNGIGREISSSLVRGIFGTLAKRK